MRESPDTLSDLLAPECIRMEAAFETPVQLLAHAALLLHRQYRVRLHTATSRLARREARRSTALGFGVALPHADMSGLRRPVAAFIRLREPMPFQAPDLLPVQDFLVLLVPRPATSRDFDLLAHYRQLLVAPGFRAALRDCATAGEIWQLFHLHAWRGPGARTPWIMPESSLAATL